MAADPHELERRTFLTLLGAAGAYATPALAGLLGSSQIASAQTSASSAISSSISESTSSGYLYEPVTLHAHADAFLRSESPNTNEGANPLLRVGVGPVTRAVVLFHRNALIKHWAPGAQATLALRIAFNGNNWGQQDDRTVDVYPLLEDFVEGNGQQSGMPGSEAMRGTGAGVTWFSPDDPNVADDSPRGATQRWDGGRRVGRKTAAGAVHINQVVEAEITWDVTQDVLAGYPVVGWLIKVTDEGDQDDWNDSAHGPDGDRGRSNGADHGGRGDERHGALPAGDDAGVGGTVWYYSSQGAATVGHKKYGPRLIITYPNGVSSTSLSSIPA